MDRGQDEMDFQEVFDDDDERMEQLDRDPFEDLCNCCFTRLTATLPAKYTFKRSGRLPGMKNAALVKAAHLRLYRVSSQVVLPWLLL